jgi:hypothetical protein
MPSTWSARPWPELAVALLLGVALVVVPLRQRAHQAEALEQARDLAARDRAGGEDPASVLAFPPADPTAGRALIATLGPARLLEARHLAPLVVAWYAGADPVTLDEPTLLLLAASTARVLGSEEGATHSASGFARASLAGLEPLRAALAARCPECVPPPAPLPSAQLELPPSLQGERVARSASTEASAESELGMLVGALRRGEAPPDDALSRAGYCGMTALELGRAGRVDQLEWLLEASERCPSALDRLAALHAALWLVQPESWPAGPARERGLALRYELEAGSR